mmetsp:Transcript_45342/g.96887  ORF Transcript_45342/g.96887 Transcript_45342/m.96887 type:complete len:103 (-) Transcript_45342:142-450(-)
MVLVRMVLSMAMAAVLAAGMTACAVAAATAGRLTVTAVNATDSLAAMAAVGVAMSVDMAVAMIIAGLTIAEEPHRHRLFSAEAELSLTGAKTCRLIGLLRPA